MDASKKCVEAETYYFFLVIFIIIIIIIIVNINNLIIIMVIIVIIIMVIIDNRMKIESHIYMIILYEVLMFYVETHGRYMCR